MKQLGNLAGVFNWNFQCIEMKIAGQQFPYENIVAEQSLHNITMAVIEKSGFSLGETAENSYIGNFCS